MSAQYSSSSSSASSQHHHSSQSQKQYYLTNSNSTSTTSNNSNTAKEVEESWKLPYAIEDEDLVFDGKPLNMLYEENRECETRDKGEKRGRGRSRQK